MSNETKPSPEEIQKMLETDPWWKEMSEEMDRVYSVHQLKGIVPDSHKHQVVEAMFENLFISAKDLAAAEGDPIFQEARQIVEGLNAGDAFPGRLFELHDAKVPGALNRINSAASNLIPMLSVEMVRDEVKRLWTSEWEVFATLDINKLPKNLRVTSADDRYVVRSLVKLQEYDDLFRRCQLDPLPGRTYMPAAVDEKPTGEISVGLEAANEDGERWLIKQRPKYIAYRIYDPLWDRRMERFEPEYVTFRLKWINETSLIDRLYKLHKQGKDVISVFISFCDDDQRLARLANAISSCPVTSAYGKLFAEIIDSYKDGRHSIAATGLLPLIEGIIWEFAWWWNNINGGLFDRPLTHAEYNGGTTEYQLLAPDGSKVNGRPNVGKLLRQTKFGEDVYFEVVEYLVAELFEERNPALHGRDPLYGTKKKAAALIFVVETLERQITGAIKKVIGKDLMERISMDEKAKSVSGAT